MQPLLVLNTTPSVEVVCSGCSPTTYVTSQLLPAVAEVLSGTIQQGAFQAADIGAFITLAGHGESGPSLHGLGHVVIRVELSRTKCLPSSTYGLAARLKRKIEGLELFQLKASDKSPMIRVRVTLVDGDEA